MPINEDRLVAIVERHWAALSQIETAEQVSMARQFNHQFRDDVREYSDEDILDRINRIRERATSESVPNPRLAAFDILASGRGQIGSNDPDARLYATTLDRSSWAAETRHGPRRVTLKGRKLWALRHLIAAGAEGLTPTTHPGPRWSDYVRKLRLEGVEIETIDDAHGGPFAGRHGRYVLRSYVTFLPLSAVGSGI